MQRTKVMQRGASMCHQIAARGIPGVKQLLNMMFLMAFDWHRACLHVYQGHPCNVAGCDFRTKASA
ncbi:MAG: hypothetical protein V4718_11065 [Pseudomonadota bacterium]